MNYKIVEKPEMVFTGYKKTFQGSPSERYDQESEFYVTTRVNQYILKGLAHDSVTNYEILKNFREDSYDFYIAALLEEGTRNHLAQTLGSAQEAERFENIVIPAGTYVACETERSAYPTTVFLELRKRIVEEWLPSSGYLLADAPEIAVTHWFPKPDNKKRYIEIWLPVEKID